MEAHADDFAELDAPTSACFKSASFSDAWLKMRRAPTRADATLFYPFAFRDLIVDGPGEHPGGEAWWITPAPAVYAVMPA